MKKRLLSLVMTFAIILVLAMSISASAEPINTSVLSMQTQAEEVDSYNFMINGTIVSVPSNAYLGDGFQNERLYVFVAQHELNRIDDRDQKDYHKGIGCYAGAEDGYWGPNTKGAVKAFQSYNSLSADGIVGPDTWYALHQYFLYW